MKRLLIAAFSLIMVSVSNAGSSLQLSALKTEYVENPLGIDISHPRFSWSLVSKQRNQSQSAYEIILSDDLKEINVGKGKLWQTGKVMSSQSLHIEYSGKPLRSFTGYYWRVKVYDQDGNASSWSEPAW